MQKQHWYIIWLFAVAKFFVPFLFINSIFQLHRDEYLYLADSAHLAWGYIEMPPLLAFLGSISLWFGDSVYAVYLWGALFGALTMIIVGKTVIKMQGNVYAVMLACLAFLCSGFLRLDALFQPNFLDVFFWSLCAYCILSLIISNNNKYFYFLGLSFGLGMMSKYTIAFYGLAFLIGLIVSPYRKWLLNPHFYYAMALAGIIWLPNLLWQYNHHFPVIHHMQLLKERLLENVKQSDFLVDQLLITAPCFFVWISGLWYVLVTKKGRKYMVIGITYVAVIALLLYFKGKGYYAVGLYPVLLGIGAVHLSASIQKHRIILLKWVMPVFMVLITWRVFPLIMPYVSPADLTVLYKQRHADKLGVLKWEDGKNHTLPQDFADMLGWDEMASKTAKVYEQLPDSTKANTFVFGDNYGQAGALIFYKNKLKLPVVYSDDASFVFWLPESIKKQNILLIAHKPRDTTDYVFGHFKKVQILDSITNTYAREYGAKIMLYSQPDDSLPIVSKIAIDRLKASYNIH